MVSLKHQTDRFRERDQTAWSVAQSVPGAKRAGPDQLRIPCPVHNGKNPNCALHWTGTQLLACCHSRGCNGLDIIQALVGNPNSGADWTHDGSRKVATRKVQTTATRKQPDAKLPALLWKRTLPADKTPGYRYLTERHAWPPDGLGLKLPKTVRWLAFDQQPDAIPDQKWFGLPRGSAGALDVL